jgi:hypothetical protein
MLPDPIRLLAGASISTERLGDLRLGSVGITLNPHFLLDDEGRRTEWLVKRLRATRFADPAAKLREFESDHRLLKQYFGAGPEHSQVLETAFVVLDRSFDDHVDYEPGREYVMLQRFVEGTTLQEAAEMYTGRTPPWLRQEVERFVVSYRRLQQIELAIPNCFSILKQEVAASRLCRHHRNLAIPDGSGPPIALPQGPSRQESAALHPGEPGRHRPKRFGVLQQNRHPSRRCSGG